MPIVLISESLLLRCPVGDGCVLRDRVPGGFCVCMDARKPAYRWLPDGWVSNSGLARDLQGGDKV